jgi:hypothetical protein
MGSWEMNEAWRHGGVGCLSRDQGQTSLPLQMVDCVRGFKGPRLQSRHRHSKIVTGASDCV